MIVHDRERRQFRADLGRYHAVLMYARKRDHLDFYHIYVPDPYRKTGLAGRLLRFAYEYALKENCRVIATCPFIAGDFLDRFPQYRALTIPGDFPFACDAEND